MVKLVGYVEMKKKVGKILFVEQDGVSGCVGKATDKIFYLMICHKNKAGFCWA